jgi:hypothetical protein
MAGVKKAIKEAGSVISAKELKAIAEKYGASGVNKAKEYAKETGGVRLNDKAQVYYKAGTFNTTSPGGNTNPGGSTNTDTSGGTVYGDGSVAGGNNGGNYGGGYTLPEIDSATRISLANIDADTQKEKQRLYNEGWVKSTELTSGATKYVSDRQKEAALGVADIETKGRLDLQAIINAGLKDVANIEGQTSRDVATIGGTYNVKQEETRQAGQKDIAKIGSRAGILQGLVGAFNF